MQPLPRPKPYARLHGAAGCLPGCPGHIASCFSVCQGQAADPHGGWLCCFARPGAQQQPRMRACRCARVRQGHRRWVRRCAGTGGKQSSCLRELLRRAAADRDARRHGLSLLLWLHGRWQNPHRAWKEEERGMYYLAAQHLLSELRSLPESAGSGEREALFLCTTACEVYNDKVLTCWVRRSWSAHCARRSQGLCRCLGPQRPSRSTSCRGTLARLWGS